MSNAINLSKDWTMARALGILRVLINQVAPDRTQDPDLIDILHLAICDVAELLSSASFPDYGEYLTVAETSPGSGVISLSSLRIDSISKLLDATNHLCVETTAKEFENLITIPQKQFSIYWYQFGEFIYFYKPSALTLGTLTLSYNRVPRYVTDTTDTLDIKDKYMKLALDKAKVMIYETLKQAPPEALTNAVNNSIAQIRQANLDEYQAVKA